MAAKVQPAEINVHQLESTWIYPSLSSNLSNAPQQTAHKLPQHISELQFTEAISSANKFVPLAGLVDNLVPTAKISNDPNSQEFGDQTDKPTNKVRHANDKLSWSGRLFSLLLTTSSLVYIYRLVPGNLQGNICVYNCVLLCTGTAMTIQSTIRPSLAFHQLIDRSQ